MRIARIVASNSHIDYVARVIDSLDVADPPGPDEFGFGRFVMIDFGDGVRLIGVVYDTKLANPEYANFSPRLSPKSDLATFSPDFLNEQGILIGILLLGSRDADGAVQGVPRRSVPPGVDVVAMTDDQVRGFHADESGRLRLGYFSQMIAHAGPFAIPLLDSIIVQLDCGADDFERRRLAVLKRSLAWQRTIGMTRL